MSERYCRSCGSEVEDVGGFCLLGHNLKLRPATDPSLQQLRDEVERAFEDVRVQVTVAAQGVPSAGGPPPPPPPLPVLPGRTATQVEELWASFDEQPDTTDDPITAFAPNNHMDWGPSESKLKTRRFRR